MSSLDRCEALKMSNRFCAVGSGLSRDTKPVASAPLRPGLSSNSSTLADDPPSMGSKSGTSRFETRSRRMRLTSVERSLMWGRHKAEHLASIHAPTKVPGLDGSLRSIISLPANVQISFRSLLPEEGRAPSLRDSGKKLLNETARRTMGILSRDALQGWSKVVGEMRRWSGGAAFRTGELGPCGIGFRWFRGAGRRRPGRSEAKLGGEVVSSSGSR